MTIMRVVVRRSGRKPWAELAGVALLGVMLWSLWFL